jgi:hypothetical protein
VQVVCSHSGWRRPGWCSWWLGISAGVPVSKAGGVVLFCWLVWCGIGAGVPIPEAGGVVLFGWHGDMMPQGVHGVGGRARCCVAAVALLCGCARPVGVGSCDIAGCGLSVVWWLVVRLWGALRAHLVGLLYWFLVPHWHPARLTSLE